MARTRRIREVTVEPLDSFATPGAAFAFAEPRTIDLQTARELERAGKVRIVRNPRAGRELKRPARESPA